MAVESRDDMDGDVPGVTVHGVRMWCGSWLLNDDCWVTRHRILCSRCLVGSRLTDRGPSQLSNVSSDGWVCHERQSALMSLIALSFCPPHPPAELSCPVKTYGYADNGHPGDYLVPVSHKCPPHRFHSM